MSAKIDLAKVQKQAEKQGKRLKTRTEKTAKKAAKQAGITYRDTKKWTNEVQQKKNEIFDEKCHASYSERRHNQIRYLAEASFETGAEPQSPQLLWFKNDKQILNLIEMRCSGGDLHRMTSKRLVLDAKAEKEMNVDVAGKVDAVIKALGFKGNFSVKGKVEEEIRKKLVYNLEF